MKRYLLLFITIILCSCGGGGGSSIELPGTNEVLPPATAAPETQTAAINQTRAIAIGSNGLMTQLGNFGLNVIPGAIISPGPGLSIGPESGSAPGGAAALMKKLESAMPRQQAPGVLTPCTDGGTYIYTQAGSTYTFTYDSCKEGDLNLTGTYVLTDAGSNNFTIVMGSGTTPLTVLDFDGDFLVAALDVNLTLNVARTGTSTIGTSNTTATGTITSRDFLSISESIMDFTNLQENYSYDTVAGTRSIALTGTYKESVTGGSSTATFSNLIIDIADISPTQTDTSVNGSVTYSFLPRTQCFSGTFAMVTDIPVRDDSTAGHTTQGRQTINGTTVIQWNADGTVTATVSGGAPITYASEDEMTQQCFFAAGLNSDAPPTTGLTGTATGNTMTITVLWTGGSTSDLDLHLNYYDTTAPTATTTGKWYVDWHTGKTCTPTTTFFKTSDNAIDVDGDTICDVGLDFDDTQGYGPEHITATKLPTGYYVVSVNSFSLDTDPSASMFGIIKIGDSVFGTYLNTFVTSDGEGTTPTAWYRLADIRVNGDGTIDILAPDPALEAWHDGAFGMTAPPLRTKSLQ